MFADFRMPTGSVVISDPVAVNELFVNNGKKIDKYPKFFRLVWELFRDSTFFEKSTPLWAEKRKHISAAFYKDKINAILGTAI